MPENKPDDWHNDTALSFGADHPDLPPLPDFALAPEQSDPPKPFVPPRFTPDILAALREAAEEVKQATLNQHLARRARMANGSEAAAVVDERISQIRGALNKRIDPPAPVAKEGADLGPPEPTADQLARPRALADDSPRGSMAAASPSPRRRAGRKPNTDFNERIKEVLQRFPNWRDQHDQMEDACEALDNRNVPFPPGSKKAVDQNWTGWMQALSLDPEWVKKALQHRSH